MPLATMEQAESSRLRNNIDRISSLPDALIHHMISFLGAREVSRLSILAKRWKTLWITSPFLNFDQSEFWCEESLEYEIDKFKDFVSTTLLRRSATASHLHTFKLSCSFLRNELFRACIVPWVLHVLESNPQVLHIAVDSPAPSVPPLTIAFPTHLFACASLENVSIHQGCFDPAPRSINLPALKRLHLSSAILAQEFMRKLLDGCPMLGDMHLEFCSLRFSDLSSSSLKHLIIRNRCSSFGAEQQAGIEFINTPNLLSFQYEGCARYLGGEVFYNMPSLVDANIALCNHHEIKVNEGNFLTGLYKVENIKLCGSNIEGILNINQPRCLSFPKLKYLFVDGLCLGCHFNVIASFSQRCPYLTKLSLTHKGCSSQAEKHGESQEPMEIACIQCHDLQMVELKYSRDDVGLHWVVKYLHDFVAPLNNVRIVMTSDKRL